MTFLQSFKIIKIYYSRVFSPQENTFSILKDCIYLCFFRVPYTYLKFCLKMCILTKKKFTVKHVTFAILCVHTSLVPSSGILLSIRDIFESNKNCNLLSSKHRKTNICKKIMVISYKRYFFALYTLKREVKRRFGC